MKLNCVICNSEFIRYGKQIKTGKTCSLKCMGLMNKAKPNTKCTNCGVDFHIKQSRKDRYSRTLGFFCSNTCLSENKKTSYKGELNHQYGLKGELNASHKGLLSTRKNHKNIDVFIYVGHEYPTADKSGRVLYHRYLVNENYKMFDESNFDNIKGYYILKDGLDVHHLNHDHNDNSLGNLSILTRSEHTKIHNKYKEIVRCSKGRIVGIKKINKPIQ